MPGRMKGKAGEWVAGGAPRAQRRPTAEVPGLSRKGPSAHIPPARPPAPEGRRRRPAQRDPAGPAPSAAAHSALPGASPGSPASYLCRTGLLSTHFAIQFQAGDFAAELKLLISVTSFFLSCDLDE
ncbi:homeobox protein unc-4 homolog isoform X2 [Equus przewalskii]|uniref:Homeobox protein unc-4 homolog isoform X2 n=1 Tax=Equus przewalskii TaxID=9798 RepID=A0ABM4Q2G8_EQUPR|nr:homeobox protein unc-4 homolog isoform X2 [Equus caballus]